jgi:hypothetical protein
MPSNPEEQLPTAPEPPPGTYTPPGFPPSSSYSLPLGVAGYVTPATPQEQETDHPATPSPYPPSSPYATPGTYPPPPPGYVPPPDYPPGSYPLDAGTAPSGIYVPPPPQASYMASSPYPSQIIRQERHPRNNTPLLILLITCGLLLIVVGGIAVARNIAGAQGNATPNAALVSDGTTTSKPAGHHFQIGQQVEIANTWLMTVNSAQTTTGNQVDQQQLKTGDTYVLVDLTIKNTTNSPQDLLGYVSFSLHDQTGATHPQAVYSGQSVPDGSLASGLQLHGLVAFEVPATLHHLTFIYSDPAFGAPVTWDIAV